MVMSHKVALSWRNEKGTPEACGPSIRSLIPVGGMMSSAFASRVVATPPDASNATISSFNLMADVLESVRADARPRGALTRAHLNLEVDKYILWNSPFPVKHDVARFSRSLAV